MHYRFIYHTYGLIFKARGLLSISLRRRFSSQRWRILSRRFKSEQQIPTMKGGRMLGLSHFFVTCFFWATLHSCQSRDSLDYHVVNPVVYAFLDNNEEGRKEESELLCKDTIFMEHQFSEERREG